VVITFRDEGISGSKGRQARPGFDRLHRAITRREIDMVAAWSVDRLGRSLQDLVGFLAELQASRCEPYLHQQGASRFQQCNVSFEDARDRRMTFFHLEQTTVCWWKRRTKDTN
jgi:hypothetical protein